MSPVLAALAVALASVGCGGDPDPSGSPSPSPGSAASAVAGRGTAEATVARLLDEVKGLEPRAAAERALGAAAALDALLTEERRKHPVDGLATVLPRLDDDGRLDVIDGLERLAFERGDRDTARTIDDFLNVGASGDAAVAALATRVAERRPDDLWIARFRPDGLEFLLTVAEDRARDGRDRHDALGVLGQYATPASINRIAALTEDPTPVRDLRNLQVGGPRPTVGRAATEALARIDARSNAPSSAGK